MSTPTDRFFTAATVPPFPARPTAVRRRPAWLIGLLVLAATTAAGVVLGPVVAVLAFDLAPLHPVTLLLGATVGALYGFAGGVLLGAVTTLVVALSRADRDAG